MAKTKISELNAATSIANADVIPIVQGGATKKLSKQLLFTNPEIRSTKSMATIGEVDKITADGTFATDTGWTVGAGWAIAGGKATHTPGSTESLIATTEMINTRTYRIVPVVSDRTVGTINFIVGNFDAGVYLDGNGEQPCWGRCSAGTTLEIVPTSDFDGSIESIEIYEVEKSIPELTLNTETAIPVEIRAGGGSSTIGIGWGNLCSVLPSLDYVGAANSEGPAGPYRGISNVAFGTKCLASVTTGKYNFAFGQESLELTTIGSYNHAFGDSAVSSTTIGNHNSGFGYYVLRANIDGDNNSAFGSYAGYKATRANELTLIGYQSGASLTTGSYNTALGANSLNKCVTGTCNVAIGSVSLFNATGTYNSALGYNTLSSLTSGSFMVGIGSGAGQKTADNAPLTDTYGILIGNYTGRTVASATNMTNYIAIGKDAEVSASNQAVIGGAAITEVYLGSLSGAAKLICSKPNFTAIPTSADGLSAGDVWSNGGILTIVS